MLNNSERISLFSRLNRAHNVNTKPLLIIGLLKLVLLTLTIILPVFYKLFVDDVLIGGHLEVLAFVILAYLGVYGLETLAKVAVLRTEQSYFGRIKLRLKRDAIRSVGEGMSHSQYAQYSVGDLKLRLEDDFSGLERFYKVHTLDFCFSLVSVVILAAIMCYMNIWLALMGVLAVPLSFWFAKFMSKKAASVAKSFREELGAYEGFVVQSFQHWKEIKSNLLERKYVVRLTAFWDVLTPLFVQRQKFWFINRGFIAFKDFFVTHLNLYFVGGLLIIQGHMTIGVLLTFMQYYTDFYGHVGAISDAIATFGADRLPLDRMLEIVEANQNGKKNLEPRGSSNALKRLEDRIEAGLSVGINVDNVHYKYPSDSSKGQMENAWIFKGLSHEFKAGTHTAITGPSGGGKTTLAKLMLGVLESDTATGTIQIEGQPIDRIPQRLLSRTIGAVMQDPYLLNLSIAENFRLANPKCTVSQMEEACKKAAIHNMICELPHGYDTIIGEKGVKLSGGQKQRLAIARVLLQNPAIIIFDESTSALDAENESWILDTFKSLGNSSTPKTLISIAHRSSTVEAADDLLVISQ